MNPSSQPPSPRPSDRLQRCLNTGGVFSLFNLLGRWETAELELLLLDVDSFGAEMEKVIAKGYGELAVLPENFFYLSRAKQLDAAHDHAQMELLGVLSEIASIAIHYIETRKS